MTTNQSRVIPWPSVLDYKNQSVLVPGTKRPGQTAHYRNGLFPQVTLDSPHSFKTLTELFDQALRLGANSPCLGHRAIVSTKPLKFANQYTWQTYAQVDVRRRNIGSALTVLFQKGLLGGGEFETVGIWSANRPEWQIIDLACQAYNKVGVSLYDTLGKDSVEYVINHSHVTVIFSTVDHIPLLLKLAPNIPMLRMIVSIDDLSEESKPILKTWGESKGIQVKDFREMEVLGTANPVSPIPATPEQIASICYTSGTSNTPKGAILTHKNLAIATSSNITGITVPEQVTMISYLPLAHIYQRVNELSTFCIAGRVGYSTGDPLRLLEDTQMLKPDTFPAVPRVLNRVYQAAMLAGSAPGIKGSLFRKAVQVKMDKLHATGDNTHMFWDRLVFRKISSVLGGNVKMITCGSAPISTEVMDFLKIAFSCEVTEGQPVCPNLPDELDIYGMTENCACCTRTWPNDPASSGTVGPPQPACEVKLVDVPAMSYTSEDKPNPRGEICLRGEQCFTAYYKDETNTKETIDDEGWLHTGDVGEIDECGRMKIIDRVKNIMKLSQGEYVALEKIENTYATCPVVAQLYVHGDSLQSYLLGIVVPDPAQLAVIASEVAGTKVTPGDQAALLSAIKDTRVQRRIFAILSQEAKKNGLKGFETLKRIHLTLEPFSIENETLTPTLKLRRKNAHNKYKSEIDAMYALGDPSSGKL